MLVLVVPLLRSIVHLSSMSVVSWAVLARGLLFLHIPLLCAFCLRITGMEEGEKIEANGIEMER